MGSEPDEISSREEQWGCLGVKEMNGMQPWKHISSFLKCQKRHEPIPSTLQAVEEASADTRTVKYA